MALLPPRFIKAVVSIDVDDKDEKGNEIKKPIATGFLFGKLEKPNADKSQNLYKLYLITNRHVFENPFDGSLLKKISLRFNTDDERKSKIYELILVDKDGKPLWMRHPKGSVDIAVIAINFGKLREDKIDFAGFREDDDICFAKDFEKEGVSMGDSIFVLGYPLSITAKNRNIAMVKSGVISRYDEETINDGFFFIDANVFPGNSGGPVILRPELGSVDGTPIVNRALLVGIVSEGITYQDVAFSNQTRRPRIVFEEQTGITKVVPVELILEAITIHDRTISESKSVGATEIEK